MAEKETCSTQTNHLRRLAEEKAALMIETPQALSPEETRRMLHELRVHQIELEIQNEELRRAQVELEAARDRYFGLYNLAPVGYCTLSEKGLIQEINLTAATLLGMARGGLVKQSISRFILKEDQDIYYFHHKQLFETGEPQSCELRMVRPDGTSFWARMVSIAAQDTDGAPVSYVVLNDITRRKQAEAEKTELEARNRQLQKAESLGRMAGAIAHHFNNQLHALMGNIDMAIGDLPLGLNPIQRLLSAMQAARKAAEVSSLMLTYLGQTPGKLEPMDLSEACRRGLTLLQAAAPHGMPLKADFPACPLVVRTNAGQIQQVLTHLVTNAWEASGENQVTIDLTVKTVSHAKIPATKRFPIDWQPREGVYACLEVADTGCGIPVSDIEKIFDPFFSTKFTARGLGLSVALGIASAHGGGITVESTPGRGSVFRFYLPVSAEDLPLQAEKKVPALDSAGVGTVLLVEDEEMVREITATMLMHLDFAVLEAKDGVEAVEVFRLHQNEIRCVLCDLTMPRMDGWETLTALRKLSPHIPVILSSGFDEAQVLAGEHSEHPNAFLGKPYDIKRLSDTIRHVAYASDWYG